MTTAAVLALLVLTMLVCLVIGLVHIAGTLLELRRIVADIRRDVMSIRWRVGEGEADA